MGGRRAPAGRGLSGVMAGLLADKIIVITGAGRGIGAAAARLFAAEGATVVLASRSADELAQVAATIEAAGGRASWLRTDATIDADLRALVSFALASHAASTAPSPAPARDRAAPPASSTSRKRTSTTASPPTPAAPG